MVEEIKNNGNGHHLDIPGSAVNPDGSRNVVSGGALEEAMRQSEGLSTIKALVVPGEKIEELLMRADFPSKYTEGHILGSTGAQIIADCIEFKDAEGLQEIMNQITAWTSADGKRAQKLVDAATGYQREDSMNVGFGTKIQEMAFGKKNKAQ